MARVRTKGFSFKGGLDIVTTVLDIDPGKAFAMENFEPWYNGGYRRTKGNEVLDGRPKPSDAVFYGFDIDEDITGLSIGTTLTGDTSSETCVVVGVDGQSIGVTKLSGTLTQGETFNTSTYTMSATPSVTISAAPTTALFKAWRYAAETEYRDDIVAPAGADEVLGIWQRKADIYSVKDNVGNTESILFRATTSGWVTSGITMAHYAYFDAGTANGPFVEGDTVTDTVSGETATIHRVVLHAGAWDGTAEGYIVLTSLTGPWADDAILQVSAATVATGEGATVLFAFPIDGEYQFINHNYFASSGTFRAYGCNGVGPAFEIDENRVVSPILFPFTVQTDQPSLNTPHLIMEHRNYLFLAFDGGTFQHSVLGEPLQYNGFLGATEFGMGDDITGMVSVAGDVLVVTSDRETRGLYGKTTSSWDYKLLSEKTGAKLFSAQIVDTVYGLDDLGITSLARTDAFGDYVAATMSQLINPLVDSHRALLTTSTVNRTSNQYRVYFSDGRAIVMYVPVGSIQYAQNRGSGLPPAHFSTLTLDKVVNRIYNTEDENGRERTYFASTDGHVYEDQIGRNFNGVSIVSYVRLAFNHMGSPGMRKRFRRLDIEVQSSETIALKVLADLDYGSPDIQGEIISVTGTGGYWDTASWDEIVWDGQAVSSANVKIKGIGENIGLFMFNDSAVDEPFTLQSCTIHYAPTRLNR